MKKFTIFTLLLLTTGLCFSQESSDSAMMSFGWVPDPIQTEAFCASLPSQANLEELSSSDNNKDILLYRPLVQLLSKGDSTTKVWLKDRDGTLCLRAYNQGNTGSCVGNATALCIAVRAAYEIEVLGEKEKFLAMGSADGMYGLAREAGNLLGSRSGGTYGSSAAKALMKYGTLWMLPYGDDDADLTTNKDSKAQKFGFYGVGDDLKEKAYQHLFITTQRITTAEEAWSALYIGAPVNVCSNVGFNSVRDENGFCRPSGSWGHSMAVIGRRTFNGKRQFLIQNSWGDNWNSGSYVNDMPFGSFWISEDSMNTMLKQGDSFAYTDFEGFLSDNYDITSLNMGGDQWLK